ncbi:AAEL000377-PA [Aedes aegypti]|uniref:AAEL000377-PA n=1 Tax=Aedes aegypti TaxID=7159 RepID=Q17PF9_AEDAE|nr:AAEL000377-PA [Aedes aegypti]
MINQLLITLTTVNILTTSAVEDWRSPQLKSFSSAQQDCAVYLLLSNETVQQYVKSGYPDEFSSRKLINCILVQIHAFDELTGIKDHVLTNFFDQPGSCSEYVGRTQECLRTSVPKHCEGQPFEHAYRSFQCYYRNYGSLLMDTVRFIPYEQVDRIKHLTESFSIVNTSCKALRELSVGQGFIVENIADPMYTLAVRSGFYDREHGLYLDRLYTQFGKPALLSDATRQCLVRVSQQYQTEPLRLTQLVLQCVESEISTQSLFTETARQVLASNSSYCNVCEQLPSCVTMTPGVTSAAVTTTRAPLSTSTRPPYPSI